MSAEFLIATVIVVAMPGAGVIYTLAVALGRGFVPAVAACCGCTLAIVPHVLASAAGLAALLHASALLFQVVKFAGVIYLLYMAWQMLREGGALNVKARTDARSLAKVTGDGILLNILNPKLSLVFVAFLPQFVPADAADPTGTLLTLSLVFMTVTFAVFLAYAASAALVRDAVLARPAAMRWLRRSFAAALALFGARLAITER